MLTLFRRHIVGCKFSLRKNRNCGCPIAIEGMLHGRKVRKSLDLRSWEAAQKLVRDWEANPNATVTVSEACRKFIGDAEGRSLSEAMVRKLKNLTKELTGEFGPLSLRSLTVDEIRTRVQTWKLAPITKQKRLEMVRSFFRFCVDSGWMDRNPAKAIRPPVVNGLAVRGKLLVIGLAQATSPVETCA